jgi:prepilin-type N-terminal cleavage/methylation domain-containing protein
MRKGFTFVEVLLVVVILPIAFLVLAGMYNTFFLEIPHSYKVIQEETTLLNLLEQFQQDIDAAVKLPESFAGNKTGGNLLLIEQPAGVICYQIGDGRVLRYQLSETEKAKDENEEYWSLPKTNIRWELWSQNDRHYAVEVTTFIEYNVHGRFERKLANSHLYYIDAL